MKKLLLLIMGLAVLALAARFLSTVPAVQDRLVARGTATLAQQAATPLPIPDGLNVYVCGSASPLGMGQAQACIAVVTPEHFYLIDSGAGSTENLGRLRLPMARLDGLLLTHFHSDHISEIYEVNLGSWVGGREQPITVMGPQGVGEIVEGINATYNLDRVYRVGHHGADLLAPELGVLQHQSLAAGQTIADGELRITAYAAEHPPIEPALGYRIDYRGRSVVVSGDGNVNAVTRQIVDGADLLLHDALSLPFMTTLSKSLADAGQTRQAQIVTDVIDYHASTESLVALANETNVGMVAFYHLVPVPPNAIVADIFLRGAPDKVTLTEDLMWFELPADSKDIVIHKP